ncbi:hypothetical protein Tco_1255763 [Tanacetum coccineum]
MKMMIEYLSIIDHNAFPEHISPITVPLFISDTSTLRPRTSSWVGFGVCPETRDRKLVMVDNVKGIQEVQDDGITQSFTMIFRIESNYPKYYNVLEFKKNGEAIIETRCANNDDVDPILQVYDPCLGCVTDIGLPWSGRNDFEYSNVSRLSMSSYMETLLLLDHDDNTAKYRD